MKLLLKVLFLIFGSISGFISCSLLLAVLVSIGNKNASFIVWDPGPIWIPLVYLIAILVLNIFCYLYMVKKEGSRKITRRYFVVFTLSFLLFPVIGDIIASFL
ncbi:putative membrane protein [Paenibacillus turicensis]|uniref:Membrane protein n=1 Tax=Paenibacillus turicensis TaxID=160487 RepID=A0ABS4FSR3_9BACL|nr:hypothetical protein [Paenibacillus turicensis]MBP1905615.1 putative membrane protein [Paenibacillus turicensis]